MKNRLHDKKAGIAILVPLILISIAEIIFRVFFVGEKVFPTSNLGEQLVVIGLALAILIMTVLGKDRLSYICYGAFTSYFVLDQLFELPGKIITFINTVAERGYFTFGTISFLFTIISCVAIIAIGILLIEYMNDGTIYNHAFNIISIITVVLIITAIVASIIVIVKSSSIIVVLAIFDNLYRLIMVFLFTFFAYDSAKKQLSKVDFSSES